MMQHPTLQAVNGPEDTFTVPYTMGGSRHDRVLQTILEREQNTRTAYTWDRSNETFDSTKERVNVFEQILQGDNDQYPLVLVSEFYLYEDAGWREQTAIELDVARFDRETRTVYCVETTGKNLESVRDVDDTTEKKAVIREEALQKGKERIDAVNRYMNRFGWEAAGEIAAFYQHGKTGKTDVEVYEYIPGEEP